MSLRNAGLAVGAGIAVFIVVGAVVTEVAASSIEFSLFVGLPAGIVAGIASAVFVYLGLGSPGSGAHRPAVGLTAFGAAFLVTLLAGAVGGLRNSVTLPIAAGVGVVIGIIVSLRRSNG